MDSITLTRHMSCRFAGWCCHWCACVQTPARAAGPDGPSTLCEVRARVACGDSCSRESRFGCGVPHAVAGPGVVPTLCEGRPRGDDAGPWARVLGLEAAYWTDSFDASQLENGLWPRAAAMAEVRSGNKRSVGRTRRRNPMERAAP